MQKKAFIACLLVAGTIFLFIAGYGVNRLLFTNTDNADTSPLNIVKAESVGERLIRLTLSNRLSEFEAADLRIAAADRSWQMMDSRLTKEIEVIYAGHSVDEHHQSVIWLEVRESLDTRGKLRNMEHQGRLPLLTTEQYDNFDLNVDMVRADKLLTWQTAAGGWDKDLHRRPDPKNGEKIISDRSWDGQESRSTVRTVHGIEVASLDQGATVNELVLIAKLYRETLDRRYKTSVQRAVDWLLDMQYDNGGWPAAYPLTGTESDQITFEHDAMTRAVKVLYMIKIGDYPFDTDLVSEEQHVRINDALQRGFAFIVDSQLTRDGVRTGWAAQYEPETMEAVKQEVAVSETIEIAKLLMQARLRQTDIETALRDAVDYLRTLESTDQEVQAKLQQLIQVIETTGYYEGHLFVEVIGDRTRDTSGQSWSVGEIIKVEAADQAAWDQPMIRSEVPDYLHEEDQLVSLEQLEAERIIVVALDGSGDHSTVQAAVDSVPEYNTEPVTIYIRSGLYYERVIIPKSKSFITFVGESKLDTVITYLDITGTGFNGNTVIIEADDFTAYNLTFANEAGAIGTASAVEVRGDRGVFDSVRFLGYQDTLYLNSRGGRFYFRDCMVQGAVDFIYGPGIGYFDNCKLFLTRSGGYITAASTPQEQEVGLVFNNNKIVGYPWVENVYFGRPWREYASDVFLNTWIDEGKIHLAGWHNWGDRNKEQTSRYLEYGSYGPGANIRYRASWTKQLSSEEAARYTPAYVLNGQDSWAPWEWKGMKR